MMARESGISLVCQPLSLWNFCMAASVGVPMTGGFAGEVAGFDQRGLDLSGASVVDPALSRGF